MTFPTTIKEATALPFGNSNTVEDEPGLIIVYGNVGKGNAPMVPLFSMVPESRTMRGRTDQIEAEFNSTGRVGDWSCYRSTIAQKCSRIAFHSIPTKDQAACRNFRTSFDQMCANQHGLGHLLIGKNQTCSNGTNSKLKALNISEAAKDALVSRGLSIRDLGKRGPAVRKQAEEFAATSPTYNELVEFIASKI